MLVVMSGHGWRDFPPLRTGARVEVVGLTWPVAMRLPERSSVWSQETSSRLILRLSRPAATSWLLLDLRTRERVLHTHGVGPSRRFLRIALRRLAEDRDLYDLAHPLARVSIRSRLDPRDPRSWSALQTMAMASGADWWVPMPMLGSEQELRAVRTAIRQQALRRRRRGAS